MASAILTPHRPSKARYFWDHTEKQSPSVNELPSVPSMAIFPNLPKAASFAIRLEIGVRSCRFHIRSRWMRHMPRKESFTFTTIRPRTTLCKPRPRKERAVNCSTSVSPPRIFGHRDRPFPRRGRKWCHIYPLMSIFGERFIWRTGRWVGLIFE